MTTNAALSLKNAKENARDLIALLEEQLISKKIIEKHHLTQKIEIKSSSRLLEILRNIPQEDRDISEFLHEYIGDRMAFVPTGARTGEWYFWDGTIFIPKTKVKLAKSQDVAMTFSRIPTEFYSELAYVLRATTKDKRLFRF